MSRSLLLAGSRDRRDSAFPATDGDFENFPSATKIVPFTRPRAESWHRPNLLSTPRVLYHYVVNI